MKKKFIPPFWTNHSRLIQSLQIIHSWADQKTKTLNCWEKVHEWWFSCYNNHSRTIQPLRINHLWVNQKTKIQFLKIYERIFCKRFDHSFEEIISDWFNHSLVNRSKNSKSWFLRKNSWTNRSRRIQLFWTNRSPLIQPFWILYLDRSKH